MAARKIYVVNAPLGRLYVREEPNRNARIITTVETGANVRIDPKAKAPYGWKAVEGGGYVMAEFLE